MCCNSIVSHASKNVQQCCWQWSATHVVIESEFYHAYRGSQSIYISVQPITSQIQRLQQTVSSAQMDKLGADQNAWR